MTLLLEGIGGMSKVYTKKQRAERLRKDKERDPETPRLNELIRLFRYAVLLLAIIALCLFYFFIRSAIESFLP